MGDQSGNDRRTTLAGAERIPPENSVEYMLFTIDGSRTPKPLARLEQLRKAAVQLSNRLTKDHVWQKDAFNLETVSRNGLVYLYGITEYGDAVEDEWLIVYMLRELSKSFPDVWVRVCDSDGEFLLVEAAKSVPRWLNPEMDTNRVWIHNGHLKVLPPAGVHTPAIEIPGDPPGMSSITLEHATQAIRFGPETLLHLPDLESEAFYRLEKYPAYIAASIHYARVALPRKVAYVLHSYPRAIAPAVEAFHYQDPILMKRLFTPGRTDPFLFPPEDLVTVSVKFTRVLYAQLRAQRFKPLGSWSSEFTRHAAAILPGLADKDEASDDEGGDGSRDKKDSMVNLGMKITCGFELMASMAELSNNRTVREIGLILEDLKEDGDGAVGVLPTDDEIKNWNGVDRDDDDSWLDIEFADLERELDRGISTGSQDATSSSASKTLDPGGPEGSGFGDARMQTDLRKIVSRFQDFLDDNTAGIEGAQFDEMDDDDSIDGEGSDDEDGDTSSLGEGDDVRFDEEEFSRLMRELVDSRLPGRKEDGLASAPKDVRQTGGNEERDVGELKRGNPVSGSHNNDDDENNDAGDGDDEQGILELAAQFEKELRGYGALNLGSGVTEEKGKQAALKAEGKDASGSVSAGVPERNSLVQDESKDGDDGIVDVDYNLARNLLESFKSQAGMAGPAGNILSMMGLSLPRDEDEDEDDGDGNSARNDDGQ